MRKLAKSILVFLLIVGVCVALSFVILGCESSILFIKGDGHVITEEFQEDNKVDPELVIDDNAIIKGIEALNPASEVGKVAENLTVPKAD